MKFELEPTDSGAWRLVQDRTGTILAVGHTPAQTILNAIAECQGAWQDHLKATPRQPSEQRLLVKNVN